MCLGEGAMSCEVQLRNGDVKDQEGKTLWRKKLKSYNPFYQGAFSKTDYTLPVWPRKAILLLMTKNERVEDFISI